MIINAAGASYNLSSPEFDKICLIDNNQYRRKSITDEEIIEMFLLKPPIFLHTPRTGGSYFRSITGLEEPSGFDGHGHSKSEGWHTLDFLHSKKDKAMGEKHTVISIVRNPFSWWLSAVFCCNADATMRNQWREIFLKDGTVVFLPELVGTVGWNGISSYILCNRRAADILSIVGRSQEQLLSSELAHEEDIKRTKFYFNLATLRFIAHNLFSEDSGRDLLDEEGLNLPVLEGSFFGLDDMPSPSALFALRDVYRYANHQIYRCLDSDGNSVVDMFIRQERLNSVIMKMQDLGLVPTEKVSPKIAVVENEITKINSYSLSMFRDLDYRDFYDNIITKSYCEDIFKKSCCLLGYDINGPTDDLSVFKIEKL